ncbi:MAG: serine hydrolase domain-containing protein, partial [Vitreimonas sp.]
LMPTARSLRNIALAASLFAAIAAPAEARLPSPVVRAIEQRAGGGDFNGVVLVAENGRVQYARAFGLAERRFGAPMQTDTRLAIASVTKLFTSALILQLVDQGRLELDAPFGRYLPDYPGGGADRVTVRMLLNHTSGLAQFDTVGSHEEAFTNGMRNYQRPLTPGALIQACCTTPLAAEPGVAFDYNNADYFVLGRIIETLTGQSYEEALRQRILAPLDLRDTGMQHWDAITPRLASSYFHRDDTETLVADMPVYWENWFSAGGMYATANDLARFADALFGARIVSEGSLRELLAPALDEYGLGLWSYSFERGGRTWRVAKRPGSIMGANAVLYRLLDGDTTIVLLANTNRTDLDIFAQRTAEALIDAGVP